MDVNNNMPTVSLLQEPKKQFWASLWFKIAAAVVLIILLGAGIALASRAWDPLWNPFRPSPEKVLQKMLENMQKISSVHTEAELKADGAEGAAGSSFLLKLSDHSDVSDNQNMKSQGKINAEIKSQGVQLSGTASYLGLGKDLFFKIDNLPAIPLLPIDLNQFTGRCATRHFTFH